MMLTVFQKVIPGERQEAVVSQRFFWVYLRRVIL